MRAHTLLPNLINTGYQIVLHQLNQYIIVFKNVDIKILGHYNNWIIMEFLYNNAPKVIIDNIRALITEVISTNGEEPVKLNGHGAIDANDEAANNFTLFALRWFQTRFKKMWNIMVGN